VTIRKALIQSSGKKMKTSLPFIKANGDPLFIFCTIFSVLETQSLGHELNQVSVVKESLTTASDGEKYKTTYHKSLQIIARHSHQNEGHIRLAMDVLEQKYNLKGMA